MILPYKDTKPKIGKDVFIAPGAFITGDVRIGDNVSIFFNSVLRGDILPIHIGAGSNIQENCILHTSRGRKPTIIEEDVTLGHRAMIHGATVSARSLIGMGAIVLDDAVIEEECMVGAGTLITEGKRIPKRSLVLGVPGRVVRQLDDKEVEHIFGTSKHYVTVGQEYLKTFTELP